MYLFIVMQNFARVINAAVKSKYEYKLKHVIQVNNFHIIIFSRYINISMKISPVLMKNYNTYHKLDIYCRYFFYSVIGKDRYYVDVLR